MSRGGWSRQLHRSPGGDSPDCLASIDDGDAIVTTDRQQMPTIARDYEINSGSDGGSDDLVVIDVAKDHAWHIRRLHQLDERDVIRHHVTHGPSNHRQPLSREGARKHVGKLVEQRHARDELYVAAFTNCRKQPVRCTAPEQRGHHDVGI